MGNSNTQLVTWLFNTDAVRVCPQNKPFWYTSGSIGPYYINTHFLYGNEAKANELLAFIDTNKDEKYSLPIKLRKLTLDNYESDKTFHGLMNLMCDRIKANINIQEIDYISGGERRDWFFSYVIAEMLQKPHITIFKDMSVVTSDHLGNIIDNPIIEGCKVLHIADLITEASSYERAWIPAIKVLGADILWSMVVVDRKQGGGELLNRFGVKSYSLIDIDSGLFKEARSLGLINASQFNMLSNYITNPRECMRNFLLENPQFLKQALEADIKTVERAKLCLDKNVYDI